VFFYLQKSGGEEAWQAALADQRERVIAVEQPRYTTVLDVSAAIDETFSREQIDQLKYRGPMYWDFDGNDIAEVTEKFQQFLGKLTELDVDLDMVRLYATGGRGYHALVPSELFLPKPRPAGVMKLPLIYKEMAYETYVDTMDLRVYSTRKGRMWRTPNVQRENERYKVPITADEAIAMTPEAYEQLCSAPRAEWPLKPAQLNNKLAVLFASAEKKIEAAGKRKKDSQKDLKLLERFKGAFPPSLESVMRGEGAANVGFHKIALQVAITANALGKKEDEVLAACAGLVEKHESDGKRYNTPAKRRMELQRMLQYTDGNPCYEYSMDAVKSVVPRDKPTPDLLGLTEEVAGEVTAEGSNGNSEGLLGGVFVTEKGVFRRSEEGALMLSDVSFRDIHLLNSAESRAPIGFEVEVLLQGRSHGRHLLDLTTFLSKQKYVQFCMGHMGVFRGNDNEVQAIAAILRDTAMKNNNVVYIVHREGLDLIQRPEAKEKLYDFVWVSTKEVEVADSPVLYKHRGSPSTEGIFKSDLTDAPDFAKSETSAKVIEALLNFNDPYAVANLLGWFVSAFHRQIYHHLFEQFPLLQVFGQSGSGKTTTVSQLLRLHYYLASPVVLQADSSTKFAIQSAIQSSASIPVALDEFKPRQFGTGKYAALLQILRSSYSAQTLAKGGMSMEINTTWRDIRLFSFSAPIIFIAEALEPETAVLERTISVPISKASLTGREAYLETLQSNQAVVSSFGKEIVRATFAMSTQGGLPAFRDLVEKHREEANRIAFKRNNHRVVFNLATVMTGLSFAEQVLAQHFGEQFTGRFAELREAMMDITKHVSVTVMPEAAKVMNILAHISRTEDPHSEFGLKPGVDFVWGDNPDHLEMNMRSVYYKYVAWVRRKGQPPLYDSEEAFFHGIGNFGPTIDRASPGSVLKESGMEKIFRFSVAALRDEGVEVFRD
jgi:hypothetical protein